MNSVFMIGGTSLGQLLNVLVTPILTRMYSREDFGVASLFMGIINYMLIATTLRFDMAIFAQDDDLDAYMSFVLCLASNIIFSVLTLIACGAAYKFFPGWSFVKQLGIYIFLLPIALAVIGLYNCLEPWNIRSAKFKHLARTKINQGIVQCASSVGIGLLTPGPLGLLSSYIFGNGAGSWLLWTNVQEYVRTAKPHISIDKLKEVFKKNIQFPKFAVIAGLLNNSSVALPAILIFSIYGARVNGEFAVAMKVIGLPMSIAGLAISKVYMAEINRMAFNSPEKLLTFQRKTMIKLLPFAGLCLFLGLTAPYYFPIVLGHKWVSAGYFALSLSIFTSGQILISPISGLTTVLKRQDLQLKLDSSRFAVIVLVFALASVLHLHAQVAIFAFSTAMAGFYFIYGIFFAKLTKEYVQNVSLPAQPE